jgi:hypothetical protein
VDSKVENDKKSADAQAYALQATLEPVKALDWKMLSALSGGGGDPRAMIAMAFRELAENAGRIGELNMSPDLLASLLGPNAGSRGTAAAARTAPTTGGSHVRAGAGDAQDALAELLERLPTRGRARFYLEQQNLDFDDYEAEDDAYRRAVDAVQSSLDGALKVQVLDRALLPTFLFGEKDVVVALGQDGLVANAAKYVGAQPLVGVNPDPSRFDGLLLPFAVKQARGAVDRVLAGKARVREVTLAEARLRDGQRLGSTTLLGAQTHVSAVHLRAALGVNGGTERGHRLDRAGAPAETFVQHGRNVSRLATRSIHRCAGRGGRGASARMQGRPRLLWVVLPVSRTRAHSSPRFLGPASRCRWVADAAGRGLSDGEKDFLLSWAQWRGSAPPRSASGRGLKAYGPVARRHRPTIGAAEPLAGRGRGTANAPDGRERPAAMRAAPRPGPARERRPPAAAAHPATGRARAGTPRGPGWSGLGADHAHATTAGRRRHPARVGVDEGAQSAAALVVAARAAALRGPAASVDQREEESCLDSSSGAPAPAPARPRGDRRHRGPLYPQVAITERRPSICPHLRRMEGRPMLT